jgi:hypothetical protein
LDSPPEVIVMARIRGVEPDEAGWFTRLVYWFVQRGLKKLTGQPRLPEPVKIMAHHPRLLRALGQMEAGQAAATSVPASLKSLASIKAATLVGCPF